MGIPPRLLHLTTADVSLGLLLAPQLRTFRARGYEVHLASAPGPFAGELVREGFTHHGLRNATRSTSPVSDLRAGREVFQLLRRIRPDIVHTHNPKPGIYGRIAGRLAGVPAVVNTQHGIYAQPTDPLLRRIAVYGAERLAAFASHAELVQSKEDLSTLGRLGVPTSRLHHLGNGVDLARFRPPSPEARRAMRRDLGYGDEAVVIGSVGRLVAEKGFIELFQAAEQVVAREPAARFLVIGPEDDAKRDAVDSAHLAAAQRSGVQLLGMRTDVERLYWAMDIFVTASHREGFPRAAMEAAASALPIVATDIRGCREVVENGLTGRLVPVRDPHALAAAILHLAADPDRRQRWGLAARTKAQREFDQETVIERTIAVYAALGFPPVTT